MKKIGILIVLLFGIFSCKNETNSSQKAIIEKEFEYKAGDIIFQTSLSAQSKAIQEATNSKYSHCGMIFDEAGKLLVYEAIQPVSSISLENWIARGKDKKYVIKRLKDREMFATSENVKKFYEAVSRFNGKDYDYTFEWSDENILFGINLEVI